MSNHYQKLCAKHQQIALLESTIATLSWDQETIIPPQAIAYRAQQIAHLAEQIHTIKTCADYQKLLFGAMDEDGTPAQQANLAVWQSNYQRNQALDSQFVADFSKTCSLAKQAWAESKQQEDFSIFAPFLAKIVNFNCKKAELWGYTSEPLDALIPLYERGMTAGDVASVFQQAEAKLIAIGQAAIERPITVKQLTGTFCPSKQQQLNQQIAEDLGFDFSAGYIATSNHPFCSTLGPYDTRITTRYYEDNFLPSLLGTIHEVGHALYEQGLTKEQFALPTGQAVSLGIHESQSLFWENHIARSLPFWQKWLPQAQQLFPQLTDWSAQDMVNYICQAKYSFIRVDADEATYDLHILLRFKIERELINQELAIADLPARWDNLYYDYFGMTPPSLSQGCLQDIHWSMGAIGYFPTYSLGNFNAAQIITKMRQETPLKQAFEQANYRPVLQWLRKEIHQHGGFYAPQQLMQKVTGEGTNPGYHIRHLQQRYLAQ